jgi:hypothetical protein
MILSHQFQSVLGLPSGQTEGLDKAAISESEGLHAKMEGHVHPCGPTIAYIRLCVTAAVSNHKLPSTTYLISLQHTSYTYYGQLVHLNDIPSTDRISSRPKTLSNAVCQSVTRAFSSINCC